jgi:predicted house-cleaning noncanonical NTP pyrophosphatase (MazG superfamily)
MVHSIPWEILRWLVKLIRDKVADIIRESGKECKYHIADYDEYKARLYEKMREELDEFISTPCYEEAADIYEVFSSICALHDMNMVQVEVVAIDKRKERGSFNDRIVLEEVVEN